MKWIRVKRSNNNKLPEELLTEEEVMKLIEATPHTRDKALVAVLWDGGLRIGEAASLKIKNVRFDKYGGILIVRGKTDWRRVRIVFSIPYLMNWIEEHPLREDPEAPLWVTLGIGGKIKPMTYSLIRKQLKTMARKAGIKKRIHAHLFRHSRATYMANHLTEAQMNEYFGWVQGSRMPSIYIHLSGRDVDKAVLKAHGIITEEEESRPKPKKCVRCKQINPPAAIFCFRCGAALDLKAAIEVEEIKSRIKEEVEIEDKIILKTLLYEMNSLKREIENLRRMKDV